MNSPLAPYIHRLLFSNDTVIVPGLGAFVAQPAPAGIDYAGGQITPPARILSFNEKLSTDDGLLTYSIVQDKNMSDEAAAQWIEQEVEDIKKQLDQREIVVLEQIGRLYKNYMQHVQFLPDAHNFGRDNFGLPPLQFSPLSRSRDVNEDGVSARPAAELQRPTLPPVQGTEISAEPSLPIIEAPRPAYRWSRVLIIAFLLAITGTAGYRLLTYRTTSAKQMTVKEQPAPTIETTDPVSEKTTPTPKNETASVMPAESTPSPAAHTVPAKKATPEPAKTTPIQATSGDRECILVIGVFKDQANIGRLKASLQQNGFTVYAAPGKSGAESVGVRFPYKDMATIQSNIIKLQQLTGEQNIWIKKK